MVSSVIPTGLLQLMNGAFFDWRSARASGRMASGLVIAVIFAFDILALLQMTIPGWWGQDGAAYWNAGLRLREGAPLYPELANPDASDVYRYSPWFAAAWAPLTLLPRPIVMAVWTSVLLGATVMIVAPILRTHTIASVALALLAGALLIPAAATGNVQPLLVALLLYGSERRSGPIWVAVAASLKFTPALLVLVYVGRRQWTRALATVLTAAALIAPMAFFDLRHYPLEVGAASGPLGWQLMWLAVIATALLSLRLAGGRYGLLTAGIATMIAIPRWSYYLPSFLLVGLARRPESER
jgi:hypothetical protein